MKASHISWRSHNSHPLNQSSWKKKKNTKKHKETLLEQDWVYFLRNLITESVKCNVPMHQNLAAFPKIHRKIKSKILYKCNLDKRRKRLKKVWLNVVKAMYLKSELYHLQTTSWSDVLSKNYIFTHNCLPRRTKWWFFLHSGFCQWKCTQTRSKELQNILGIKGIKRGNGMETHWNAGGPKLTWSRFIQTFTVHLQTGWALLKVFVHMWVLP